LQRATSLEATEARYVEMIEAASIQLGELIDELALAARIEAGSYEPTLEPTDTLRLVRAAQDRLGPERVAVHGPGGRVAVDPRATEHAVAALAEAARRHGGFERVTLEAGASAVTVTPVTSESAPIVLGQDLRDLGAAVAGTLVSALGGSLELGGEALVVRFPAA
jgi:signal transduction histidine kinase